MPLFRKNVSPVTPNPAHEDRILYKVMVLCEGPPNPAQLGHAKPQMIEVVVWANGVENAIDIVRRNAPPTPKIITFITVAHTDIFFTQLIEDVAVEVDDSIQH